MAEDVYFKLRDHLNNYPLWAPESKEFLEILQLMFTPEEAELALSLTPHPEPVSRIAERTNEDLETVQKKLERMVEKGLLKRSVWLRETTMRNQWNQSTSLWKAFTAPNIHERLYFQTSKVFYPRCFTAQN